MMENHRPNKCKWCGAKIADDALSLLFVRFACRSSFWIQPNEWQMSKGCAFIAANQVDQYRDRIQRALQTLKAVERFDVIPWDGGVAHECSESGGEVDADIVDQVIQILEGQSDG